MMVPVDPFVRISIDFVGPLKETPSGNLHVFVMVDQATRWAEMVATPDQTTETVVRILKEVLLKRYGRVRDIICDNGASFTSEDFMEFCRENGMMALFVSPYHPQSNAFVERVNGTFKGMLAKCVNEDHTDWDEKLGDVNFSYNTAVHSVTKFSPYYLLYGKHPILPIDNQLPTCEESLKESPEERRMRIYRERLRANENCARNQLRDKIKFDNTHEIVVFNKGDKVLHRNFNRKPGTVAKFMVKWKGPYTVYDRVGGATYMLQSENERPDEVLQAHVNNLKKYETPDDLDQEEEVEYDSSWLDTFIPMADYPEFYEDYAFVPGQADDEHNNMDNLVAEGQDNNEVVEPVLDQVEQPVNEPVVEEEQDQDSDVEVENANDDNDNQSENMGDDDDGEEEELFRTPTPEPTRSRSGREIRKPDKLQIDPKLKSYKRTKVDELTKEELLMALVKKALF